MSRIRHIAALLALLLMAACDAAPAGPTPMAGQAATPLAAAPSARPTDPPPTAISTPSAAPTETPAPSATPAASATVTAAPIAPPTATPAFPEARITADSLAGLRPLRTVGLGGAVAPAISPDNRLLAVATSAGLALFELPGLRHLRFDQIDGGVSAVAFSADGQSLTVATGSQLEPGETQLRRVADGAILQSSPAPAAPEPPPLTLDSPDGRLRISYNPPDSSPTPGVRLTRVADGRLLYEDALTDRAAFSADSSLVALAAYDGAVWLLDANGQPVTPRLELPEYWSLAFSPDGLRMATAGRGAWLWDVVSGELQERLSGMSEAEESWLLGGRQRTSFSPDGALLTIDGEYYVFEATLRRGSTWALGPDGAAYAWHTDLGGLGIDNYTTYVAAISSSSDASARTDDGQTLAIGGGGWAPQQLQVPAGVSALAFSPDGALLAVADKAGQIQLLQEADGAVTLTMQADTAPTVLQFSPDGVRLGGRSRDGALQIWAAADGAAQTRIAAPPLEPGTPPDLPRDGPFLFTPDGAMLISWGRGPVRLYRLSDGQLLHQIDIRAEDVAIGPRQRLLGIVRDGRAELWGLPPGP